MSSNSAVELKGSMYTFLSLKLHSNDSGSVASALADKVQQAPGFFANTPVVVDLTPIEDESGTDAPGLLAVIREHKLVPVVVSISDKDSAVAASIDIPLVEAGNKRASRERDSSAQTDTGTDKPQPPDTREDSAKPAETASLVSGSGRSEARAAKADTAASLEADIAMAVSEVEYIIKSPKLVTRPVRSGQQVYARDTDLVVIGQVGPGAEIIADNNVHVYGPLRGRALCGVAGNTEARIFCQSLEAELVSVAGNYKVLEEIPAELRGKPAQIWYANDKLMIEPL